MHIISRRAFGAGAAAGLGASLLPLSAGAQQTPDWAKGQTIKLVAPFPPGGSVDAISRMAQPGLQQRLGATVVVENRPGAGGAVGANSVAKSAPDGTNILVVFDSHAVLPALMPLQYDSVKDLDPLMLVGTAPMVLACHPSRPFRSLKDVIEASKAKPDSLAYGTVGNGSLGHLLMVLLGKKGGFVTRHLPYRGGGPAVNDAVGGHIDLIIGSAALLSAQIDGGRLRPLMQSGSTRAPTLKDVPTIAESGFPGSEAYAWWGIFVRAGTPARIKDRIYADLRASLEDPSVRPKLESGQQVKLELSGAKEFAAFFAKQMQVWGDVVKENGIKPD